MAKSKPFVVPEGVVFQIEDDGVTIENAGDIVLHTDFGGRTLKRIVSREGDIELHGTVNAGELHAAGSLRAHGNATVATLRTGGDVVVQGDANLANIIAGGELRVTGSAQLGNAELASGLDVGGKLSAGHLRVAASAAVAGDLGASSVSVGSSLTVGGSLQSGPVQAGGDVKVGGNTNIAGLHSGGTVALAGAVVAATITAQTILLSGPAVQTRGLQGALRVAIGAAKVTVDAIIAPQVDLDPKTSGRVTVIELQNELGPNAVKGGFRLADYGEMFGNPEGFLAERGLVALGDAPAAPPDGGSAPAVAPPAEPIQTTANTAVSASQLEQANESAPAAVESEVAESVASEQAAESAAPQATAAKATKPDVEPVESEPLEGDAGDEPSDWEVPVAAVVIPPAIPVVAEIIAPEAQSTEESIPVVEAVAAEADSAETEPADDHATGEPARIAIPSEPARPSGDPFASVVTIDPVAPNEPASPNEAPAASSLSKSHSMHDDDPLSQAAEHPMHGQLADTVQRIVDCYAGQEVPPAVENLRKLVAARQYPQIRAEITNIWSELLKFHQKKGMRIQHQVTTTFNSVNGLVKKM